MLGQLADQGRLRGATVGVDATTLEANAAMESIVRQDTGADWQTYLRTLAQAEGITEPTAADLQRLDRARRASKCPMNIGKTRMIPTPASQR